MKRIILTLLSAVVTLTVSAQQADTTFVVYYGYQPIDTITISKTSKTFLQLQEAESVVKGITDEPTKHRVIVEYVLSHPDSDGSIYLMRYLSGMINYNKCLPVLTERVRQGVMKRLYDCFVAAKAEEDAFTSITAKAIKIGEEAADSFEGTAGSLRYMVTSGRAEEGTGKILSDASIKVNSMEYASDQRGLHFAVFDKSDGELMDACWLDIFSQELSCYHDNH